MQRFKITVIAADHVYVDGEGSGERWCEVQGSPGVDREQRAEIIVNALYVYSNHVYPHTKRGSRVVAGFPQMELQFPER